MAESKSTHEEAPGQEPGRRCRGCSRPIPARRRKCDACSSKHAAYMRDWYEKAKARGICHTCCKPLDRDNVTCSACAERFKDKRQAIKMECFIAYGGSLCACCGEATWEFLSLDHIHGNGADERRGIKHMGDKTGYSFFRRLKRLGFPPGYQVLCLNCNCAKRDNSVCPHQKEKDDAAQGS